VLASLQQLLGQAERDGDGDGVADQLEQLLVHCLLHLAFGSRRLKLEPVWKTLHNGVDRSCSTPV
jgi:hypothetical protein